MEGESREAECAGVEEVGSGEREEQPTSKDEAYENLTLQLGKHFRSNSISCVRGLVANPDCLGEVTSANAVKLGSCIVFPYYVSLKVYRNCKWRGDGRLVSIPREAVPLSTSPFHFITIIRHSCLTRLTRPGPACILLLRSFCLFA